MPGYILAPLFIGAIGSLVGVILGVYVGAPGMLSFYEDMIGLPIKAETDTSLVLQIVGIAMLVVLLAGLRPAWQASPIHLTSGSPSAPFPWSPCRARGRPCA